MDIFSGCFIRARELFVKVLCQGVLFPRLALPPLRGRAQRSARHPEVRGAVPGLRRLQGSQIDQGRQKLIKFYSVGFPCQCFDVGLINDSNFLKRKGLILKTWENILFFT